MSAQGAGADAQGVKPQHKWVHSTLGHGEQMCAYCKGTNRELAVLGMLDYCDKAPVTPSKPSAAEAVAWRWRYVDNREWAISATDPTAMLSKDAVIIEPLGVLATPSTEGGKGASVGGRALEPRNQHGQPVSCAPVWVADTSEPHGGHWTADCPHLKETGGGFEGERYRCQRDGCGYSYFLDYEDMK